MCTELDPTVCTPEVFWMSFSCLACKTWLLLVVLDRVRADLSSAAALPRLCSLHVLIPECRSLFPGSRNALQLAGGEMSDHSPSVLSFSCQLAPGICLFTRLLFPGCYTAQGAQVSGGFGFPGWGQGGVGQCKNKPVHPSILSLCHAAPDSVGTWALLCWTVFPQGAESRNGIYCF